MRSVSERPIAFQRLFREVRGRLLGEPGGPLRLGRYLLGERLGAGGMGVVYAGVDPELDRKVAIKLVRPDRAGARGAARDRLLREAQAMARISSPHAVTVYEAGTWGEQVFVVMELVDGTNLTQWLQVSSRTWREVQDVFVQAGRGLWAAHQAGLVHRDFKPESGLKSQVPENTRVFRLRGGFVPSLYQAEGPVKGYVPSSPNRFTTERATILGA